MDGLELQAEYRQAREEGRDLSSVEDEFRRLLAAPKPRDSWYNVGNVLPPAVTATAIGSVPRFAPTTTAGPTLGPTSDTPPVSRYGNSLYRACVSGVTPSARLALTLEPIYRKLKRKRDY